MDYGRSSVQSMFGGRKSEPFPGPPRQLLGTAGTLTRPTRPSRMTSHL